MQLNNIVINTLITLLLAASQAQAGEIVDDTRQAIKLDYAAGVLEGLQRGLDINFVDDNGDSLLMLAAQEGSTRSTAILLNAGAKTFFRNAFGDDALLLATFWGHVEIVDMLLAKRANLGANPRGWTPLHYAAYAGHAHLAQKFLALGAQTNSATDNGLTALMLASKNGHIDVVRILLMHKADVTLRDENKLSAVDHALASNNSDIASLLLQPPALLK